MSRVKRMTMEDLVAKTPLEPFNEVGAAYNCLKALLWLVSTIKTPRRHYVFQRILEIAEELQEWEGGDDEGNVVVCSGDPGDERAHIAGGQVQGKGDRGAGDASVGAGDGGDGVL